MIEATGERYNKYTEITDEINRKLKSIDEAMSFSSSFKPITDHPDFHSLIAEGDKLIPYLMHVITHRGATWPVLLLLTRISPENPIKEEHRGHFYHIINDWLGWYLTSKYRDADNIYHGLVE